MSDIKIVLCEYKDGKPTYFYENIFELTTKQREDLKRDVSQMTQEEHKKDSHKIKMRISDTQQEEILTFHKDLITILKEVYSVDSDEELAQKLYNEEIIVFSPHALERLVKRFSSQSDSPFSKMFEFLDLDPQKPSDLALEATEIFVKADKIQPKIEWSASPFCRINYSLSGDKTILSVENKLLSDSEIQGNYVVITVMKNSQQ